MRRAMLISLLVMIVLVITSAVSAQRPWWGSRMGYSTNVNPEKLKKFQKETLELRDELLTKQADLQSESNKDRPDYDRIIELRKDIVTLQTKIQAIAEKYGFPDYGSMGNMMGCDMMMQPMRDMGCRCMGWH